MNSSELSRKSVGMNLQNYVRLSFNEKNPMFFKVLQEKRVKKLVMLQIKPGVLFLIEMQLKLVPFVPSSPEIVRFDVVKAKNQFVVVETTLKQFYQAEV